MRKFFAVTLIVIAFAFNILGIGWTNDTERIELPIIMYHNIVPDNITPNKYEIRLSAIEKDFMFLKENGFTAVNTEMLENYTKGGELPHRVVMLTFDDGFYNYNRYLPALLEKYDMRCIVSVVGSFTKFNKNTDALERYTYMDYDDMAELNKTGRVEIANHTYDMHKNKKGSCGAKIRNGESEEEYRTRFMKDTDLLEEKISALNIKMKCYTYPYGAYCKESEAYIKERNYKMSLTCEERVNYIRRNPNSLYRLGRYNRDGNNGKSVEFILKTECSKIFN